MILRALIALAALVPCAALAAPKPAKPSPPPANAAEFASLPALGTLVEGGIEKEARFRTYLVSKRPTIQGPISIFIGELQIRTQDMSPGAPRPVKVEKWKYAARCSGDANTIGVNAQRIVPPDKSQTYYSVYPGTEPDPIDRTWYNVWYAVCLDDFNKYPRKQEE